MTFFPIFLPPGLAFVFLCPSSLDRKVSIVDDPLPLHSHYFIVGNQAKVYVSVTKDLDWSEMTFILIFNLCFLIISTTFILVFPSFTSAKAAQIGFIFTDKKDELKIGRGTSAPGYCLLFYPLLGFQCTSGYVRIALPGSLSESRLHMYSGEYISCQQISDFFQVPILYLIMLIILHELVRHISTV